MLWELQWCLTCLALLLLKESEPHWPPLWPLRWLWFSSGQEADQESSPLSLFPHLCCPLPACQVVCKVCWRYTNTHQNACLKLCFMILKQPLLICYDFSFYLFISPMSWTPLSNSEVADKPPFTICKRAQIQLATTNNEWTSNILTLTTCPGHVLPKSYSLHREKSISWQLSKSSVA